MAYYCHACRNEVVFEVKVGIKVGRRDTCPHCSADLHACKNCRHYDASLHNQCREPEASFIRDREAANFCAHFDMKDRDAPAEAENLAAAKSKLEALFRKKT